VPSRREQIEMTDEEVHEFLAANMVMQCATNGPHGLPHLVPLWFTSEGTDLTSWTYAKSQKAKNLERDPRATLQVEAGLVYEELRGVMLRCDVVIHRELEVVEGIAMELVDRYSGPGPEFDPVREGFRRQAPKRVGLEFAERERVTWDHRKLGGAY
jgi:hypothetical protein